MRTSLRACILTSLVVGSVALLGCSKKQDATASGAGSAGGGAGASSAGAGKSAPHAGGGTGSNAAAAAGCKLPEDGLSKSFTIGRACDLKVETNIIVTEDATLTIEAGAKLRFEPGTYLDVRQGKLVAKGTDKEPILFTSSNKTQAPGDWCGISFDERISAGNVLDHVIVEYAGRNENGFDSAIQMATGGSDGRVAITNSIIRNNIGGGVHNFAAKNAFARFDGNTFQKNSGRPLTIHAGSMSSVTANNNWGGEPVHTGQDVEHTTTWPALNTPIIVDENLRVVGKAAATVLTLGEKTTLKFKGGTFFEVGVENGGGLVAKGVTFTSANATPDKGDWVGIVLDERATQTVIDGCTIEYAGRNENGGSGGITVAKPEKVVIKGTTFRNNLSGGISAAEGNCGESGKPSSGNKSEGVPLCKAE